MRFRTSTAGQKVVCHLHRLFRPYALRFVEDDVFPAVVDSGRGLPQSASRTPSAVE